MCRCAAAIARAVVAFLDAVLVGCLLSCFRPRRRGSGSASGRIGALVYRDRAEEDLTDGGVIDEEQLRKEANYLKLCGTICQTPVELQNECDNMPTNVPPTNCSSLFKANSSKGCGEHHAPSKLNLEDTQHLLGVESVHHSAFMEKSPLQNNQHKLHQYSGSPFATPLVLSDDMQTPGTVYTSHRGASMSGKRVQTRKQFIYPVLRPIENRLQQMKLTEDSSPLLSSNPPKRRNLEEDSVKKPKQTSSNSVAKSGFLSHWVKSSKDVDNQGDVKGAAGDQYDECSFPTNKPVFMASDLNWDIENPTPRLPKTWDGSCIPNTTTRYKEDQRVSWHTTPFEERLLKVLSDKEHCSPRKVVCGKLFHQEEKAE
ncbi:unnamed protein product [Urochloa decumbens]|uniref:Protein JASON-like n=1 Tax=Urochloa decumbens TaxID=240449 RepID=A0ABC9E1L9_9POAL